MSTRPARSYEIGLLVLLTFANGVVGLDRVDEAILLADRVVVLSGGRVSLDRPVNLPFPRSRGDDGFDDLRRTLLAELGVQEEVGHDQSA